MANWENNIRKVVPYTPGEQPNQPDMIKLNTNENPYPPAPGVREVLRNMDTDTLKEAIAYIDGRAEIEVSGNVTKENITRLINLGVDFVSSGALTHSAPILDISLKNLHPVQV